MRTPDEIRADIERTRGEIARSIGSLRENLDDATDWHRWVERRPLEFLGAAFLVGLVVGYRRGAP